MNTVGQLSHGREEAFDLFKRDFISTPAGAKIEAQKAALRVQYAEAKALGQAINSAKQEAGRSGQPYCRHCLC
ncbi:unnamed protein product [Protopolystoma xenopodis]|uniref:Kinesin-like protein KIF6/9 C-terminal domain-containing protein n=1 Tax=Protopolystoma xenopodis TaxID=117903 RepID=A0A448WPP5_9PLAT|nr:unnamed protein product [Protopolystoma xenopodis]